jgi:diacylglycerol kinase (ATP)
MIIKHLTSFFRGRMVSIKYALRGLLLTLKREPNFRLHLLAAMLVSLLGMILHISRYDWIAVILCIGLVLMAEIMNTAIEKLVDMISPERHEQAGRVKDIAAAGVLIASFAALLAGFVIFIPYFTE